jgi:ABC-type phosphate transport system substrate-binding protein
MLGENRMKRRWSVGILLAAVAATLVGCSGGGGASSDTSSGGGGSAAAGHSGGEIIRVSRQNNSGTYAYFRETVIGEDGQFKLGSLDQSGSKDVVELVSTTPTAIGYSGMGYATDHVKMLAVSKDGGPAVPPTSANASNGTYPIARGLNVYIIGEAEGAIKHYLDWCLSSEGQKIVEEIGYVPAPNGGGDPPTEDPPESSIKVTGSDTMVNLAQAWAETYTGKYPQVSLEVSGGGSGVGLAGLQDGTVQMANASRDIKDKEREAIKEKFGKEVTGFVVALDALAVYVHPSNPLTEISISDLKEIYGEGGTITTWEQVHGWPTNQPASAAAH